VAASPAVALLYGIGVIEGTVVDELLVRFGEVVVRVSPEMVEAVEG
jgi:hypothetical protein